MKKLELKDIAGYLPYGLKILRPDQITVLEVRGLLGTLVQHEEKGEITYSSLSGCRPYLRPMSDLTREITHKGEKFVPIVELAKMVWPKGEEMWHLDDEKLGAGDEYLRLRFANGCLAIEGVGSNDDYSDTPADVFKLFDLLHEWMFDYRDLIGQELAIDVNTLKENCYE